MLAVISPAKTLDFQSTCPALRPSQPDFLDDSKEYFSALDPDTLDKAGIQIITPQFKDWKNGAYKFITFYGKRARGMMVDYLIRHRLDSPEPLQVFDTAGYAFNNKLSRDNDWVFTRKP